VNELKEYEVIFITKTDLNEETGKKILAQVEGEVSKNGGSVSNIESWGRRRLSHLIKKNKEGNYYKVDFAIEPGKISELKKAYGLNESILRAMIAKK